MNYRKLRFVGWSERVRSYLKDDDACHISGWPAVAPGETIILPDDLACSLLTANGTSHTTWEDLGVCDVYGEPEGESVSGPTPAPSAETPSPEPASEPPAAAPEAAPVETTGPDTTADPAVTQE